MTSEVQNVILESDIPMLVNISTEATDIATKGNPMPKYTDGTHKAGFGMRCLEDIFLIICCKNRDLLTILRPKKQNITSGV